MQQWKIVCIVLMLCAVTRVSAQDSYENRVKGYIEQYKDWAIAEQKRSGVPAAITLAQGIHETSAGRSELALNANNHFGIKCKREWNGETYAYTDDAPDECFRKYPSALQSYKDHSDYLAGSQRYAALFKLSSTDYAGWAHGLKRCGYATNPKYSQILIRLIETYNLQQYTFAAQSNDYNPVREAEQQNKPAKTAPGGVIPDQDAAPAADRKSGMAVSYGSAAQPPQAVKKKTSEEPLTDAPETPEYGLLVKVNGLKAFYAKKGSVLLQEAFRYNIRYAKLLEINELPDAPLEADMYIFLEKKNPRGIHATHTVQPGETLTQIAQAEAMQLKYLKYYNHIGANEEPVAGATLQLQQYTEHRPATYPRNVPPREDVPVAFAGSSPRAIPQGTTRVRSAYISKKELNAGRSEQEQRKEAAKEDISVTKEHEDEPVPAPEPVAKKTPEPAAPEVIASEPVTEKTPEPAAPEIIASEPVAEKTPEPDVPEIITSEPVAQPKITEPMTAEEITAAPGKQDGPESVPPVIREEVPEAKTEATEAVVSKEDTVPVPEETKPVTPPVPEETKPVAEVPAPADTETVANHQDDPVSPAAVKAEAPTAPKDPAIETAPEHVIPKQEEIDYEIIQPEPVIVSKDKPVPEEKEVAAVETPREEVPAIPAPEHITPVAPVRTEAVPEPSDKVSVPTPAKLEVPQMPEEPKDEYARLKAKLDKVVYASDNTVPSQPAPVPPSAPAPAPKKAEAPKQEETAAGASKDLSGFYTVKKGDTAFGIAKKHKITMRQLMDWNKLEFQTVKPGQQLRVKK